MSTGLDQLRQESIEIRLPGLNIKISHTSDVTDDGSVMIQSENSTGNDQCHTPKSPQNMIPTILSCPPAPKKPSRRPVAASCKRKLSEFFELVAREEVESFFRQFDCNNNNGDIKKRCLL